MMCKISFNPLFLCQKIKKVIQHQRKILEHVLRKMENIYRDFAGFDKSYK